MRLDADEQTSGREREQQQQATCDVGAARVRAVAAGERGGRGARVIMESQSRVVRRVLANLGLEIATSWYSVWWQREPAR